MVPSDDPNMGPNQSIPILEKFSMMTEDAQKLLDIREEAEQPHSSF